MGEGTEGIPFYYPKNWFFIPPMFSHYLIFSFYAIFDNFAQNVLPLPLVEPKWETLGSIYVTSITRNQILFMSK